MPCTCTSINSAVCWYRHRNLLGLVCIVGICLCILDSLVYVFWVDLHNLSSLAVLLEAHVDVYVRQ